VRRGAHATGTHAKEGIDNQFLITRFSPPWQLLQDLDFSLAQLPAVI